MRQKRVFTVRTECSTRTSSPCFTTATNIATILEANNPKSRKHFLINAVQISNVTVTSLPISLCPPRKNQQTRWTIPCPSFCESFLCSMFEIFPHLFEFGGSGVSIVSEVGEFRRVWFWRVCCSWRVAFGDETDVFGLTPCDHHPQE